MDFLPENSIIEKNCEFVRPTSVEAKINPSKREAKLSGPEDRDQKASVNIGFIKTTGALGHCEKSLTSLLKSLYSIKNVF
jgi:hypothetical protein